MSVGGDGELGPTPATQVRLAEMGRYDRETVYGILDEGWVAHLGLVHEGRPLVIPMVYARLGDDLLLHGAPATRLFRDLRTGPEVCVTVTLVDGLVLARSAFNHTVNYRSVVVFGTASPVEGEEERRVALDAITDRLVPGRSPSLRPMSEKELKGTRVVRVPLVEASAKISAGWPEDEDEDYELPIWAGVLPMRTVTGPAKADRRNHDGVEMPEHVRAMETD